MMTDTLKELFNHRLSKLSALAFFITCVLIAYRSSVGFGSILAAGLISYLSAWLVIREIKKGGSKSLLVAFSYYLMIIAFIIWLSSFVLIESAVIAQGEAAENITADYLIVLGAGLKGEEPSVSLSSRLQKASEYLSRNPSVKVIVSGGKGKGENITEAEAMKRYLISSGIEEERIIKEEQSTSTKENLVFSKMMLGAVEGDQGFRVIVITSDYHIFRTKMLAEGIELEISALPSKTPLNVFVSGCIREYFAIMNTFIFN